MFSLEESEEKKKKRSARFLPANDLLIQPVQLPVKKKKKKKESEQIIFGTSTSIEKSYLRLTSEVKQNQVRNEETLQKALDVVKMKWKKDSDYKYVCEQLKSIRQDLTVQSIKNELTLEVYQTHARIALEVHDINEFNQCLTIINELFEKDHLQKNRREFLAYQWEISISILIFYRLLYFLYNLNWMGINRIMSRLKKKDWKDKSISNALQVISAFNTLNFKKFFKLYRETPDMGAFILDFIAGELREYALRSIVRSYQEKLSFAFIIELLAFNSEQEFIDIANKLNLVIDEEESVLLTKESKNSINGG